MARETMLAKALVELADNLVADFDVAELLIVLTDRCVDVLDVAAAGIMLASPAGDLRVMASSSEEMRLLELFELQSHEGPCLDCYNTGEPVVNVDLRGDDQRWPLFAPRASAAGFRSVHALPMRLRGTIVGALNLFSVDAGLMRPADMAAGQALADVATIAILQHQAALEAKLLNEQLSEALNTPDRDRAGQGRDRRAAGRRHDGRLHRPPGACAQAQPPPGGGRPRRDRGPPGPADPRQPVTQAAVVTT